MQISKTSLSYRIWQRGLAVKNHLPRLYGVGYHNDRIPDDLCRYINRLFLYFLQLTLVASATALLVFIFIVSPIDVGVHMYLQHTTDLIGLKTFFPYSAGITVVAVGIMELVVIVATVLGTIVGIIWGCREYAEYRQDKLRAARNSSTYVESKPNAVIEYIKAKHEGICKHLSFVEETSEEEQPTNEAAQDEIEDAFHAALKHLSTGPVDLKAHEDSTAEFKALNLSKEE